MRTRDGLLDAVRTAHRDDHSARLVYADWLDEFGDEHDRARAELIRLACTTGLSAGVKVRCGVKEGAALEKNINHLLPTLCKEAVSTTVTYRSGNTVRLWFAVTYKDSGAEHRMTGRLELNYHLGFLTTVTFMTPSSFFVAGPLVAADEPLAAPLFFCNTVAPLTGPDGPAGAAVRIVRWRPVISHLRRITNNTTMEHAGGLGAIVLFETVEEAVAAMDRACAEWMHENAGKPHWNFSEAAGWHQDILEW